MATLIQFLALLPLLAAQLDAVEQRHFPRPVQPDEWESIALALSANPDVLRGVVRDQSFRVDERLTVLSFFLGPPAGKYKRGELGVVLIRDHKLKQIERGPMGNPTAIDAVGFLDLNDDGLRDMVMFIRYLSPPGPKEWPAKVFLVGRKDGTFAIDPRLAPWAVEAKTIAEIKALMKEANKPAAPPPPPTHTYVMDGFLDKGKLKCTGKAAMEKDRDEDKSPCLVWTLSGVKCKGKGDADWVHGDAKNLEDASARICFKKGSWEYVDDLPGLGSCDVNQAKEAMPAKISPAKAKFVLGCMWTCRGDARESCEGAASYEFVPLPAGAAKQ
jgi:hypothetical protein